MQNKKRLFLTIILFVIAVSATISGIYVYVFAVLSTAESSYVKAGNQVPITSTKSVSPIALTQANPEASTDPNSDTDSNSVYEWSHELLDVPFVSEAPDNNWTGSWKNACEEASVTMVDKYYQGIKDVSIAEEKKFMQTLFDAQVKLYGSDANSDSIRTMALIDKYATFSGDVINNPTIEDIMSEIDQGRPVIAFHRGFDLKNANIPFLSAGSSYHSTVVVGYDAPTRVFIVHDPGDTPSGANHKYDFDVYMNSLHDYNHKNDLADGPARVIFTKNVENN